MRIAYFHSIGGASGDMMLGALVDAGVSVEALKGELAKLSISGFQISARQDRRAGLLGTRVLVETEVEPDASQPRSVSEFIATIGKSTLDEAVKKQATQVLKRLGEAEKRAHRLAKGEAVLHELGDLDTLVDVVGTVACIHLLGIQEVYASALLTGSGVVQSSHGAIPVPGPATMELIADVQATVIPPSAQRPMPGELTTPTGAALLTTLASFDAPSMTVERIGYGLGTRDDPARPNALSVWLGERQETPKGDGLRLLETNVDDSTPELLAYAQEQLLALGAADVWFTSIQMKKSRPGVLLSALVSASLEGRAAELILRETSTLGIRVRPVERYEALREVREVTSPYGTVPVKIKRMGHQVMGVSPEYEPCRRIAQERGLPLAEVYRLVSEAAWEQVTGQGPQADAGRGRQSMAP